MEQAPQVGEKRPAEDASVAEAQMPAAVEGAPAQASAEGEDMMMQHMPVVQMQMQQQALAEDAHRSAAFWTQRMAEIQAINPESQQADWTQPELPLARIKKIMKTEDEVKSELGGQKFMVGAEAPIMLAKACEIFVQEMTSQAWHHTEESKRRTLQRNDIVLAVGKNDTYDFLIDIVPRENGKVGGVGKEGTPAMDTAQLQALLQQQFAQVSATASQAGEGAKEGEANEAPKDGESAKPADGSQAALAALHEQQMASVAEQMAANPQMAQQIQYQLMWQQQMQMQQQWRLAQEGKAAESQATPAPVENTAPQPQVQAHPEPQVAAT